jgi:hypothetical protein
MRTIVWDVDDVLNDLMAQWFSRGWKRERPTGAAEYCDLNENPPHASLGVRSICLRWMLSARRMRVST